ncbi:MAG: PHP domain-containing protein [Ignavibacteriae bacterium]|nr:MAG: PHP domain-containing protein [Ignavibacteriota bacterium]
MKIKADIHIHTCLSPCADILISPKRIVEKAFNTDLNMIFITDHNSLNNAEAAIKAARYYPSLAVYPGMEITSREEVHILGLFGNMADALSTEEVITTYLPDAVSDSEYREQIIANEFDEVEGFCLKSLFNAVNIKTEDIIKLIHNNNGIAAAAHIDRPSFSIISQLGFIPDDIGFDALEISPNLDIEKAKEKYPEYLGKYKFLRGSDSHSLNWIGSVYTEFEGKNNTFGEFAQYLIS